MDILTVANMYPSDADPVYGTFVRSFVEQLEARNPGGRCDRVVIAGRRRGKWAKLRAYASFYPRAFMRMLFGRYDLIYIHTITFPMIVVRAALLLRPRLPLVFNVHGGDVLPRNRFIRRLRSLAPPALRRALMVVSPSEYFRKVLLREFPDLSPDKIFVSPSGGIDAAFYNAGVHRPALDGRPLVLGYVSRIDSGKGWEVFVEAVYLLRRSGLDVRGVMAGRGEEGDALARAIAGRGLTDVIDVLGAVPREELPRIYGSLDIMAFPTLCDESLGLVGIEAMAAGVPVVASAIGGPTGYVRDGVNGYLFPPGDAVALAACVDRFVRLHETDRRKMARAALETARPFEATRVADDMYARLCALVNTHC